MTLYTVILDKGSKGKKEFDPAPFEEAKRRADALCDLHSCDYATVEHRFIVHAAEYYNYAARVAIHNESRRDPDMQDENFSSREYDDRE